MSIDLIGNCDIAILGEREEEEWIWCVCGGGGGGGKIVRCLSSNEGN